MVKVSIELECDTGEVIQVLRRIIPKVSGVVPAQIAPSHPLPEPAAPVSQPQGPPPGPWTTELAKEFTDQLEPDAREVLSLAWRSVGAGVHRNTLRQRTGLAPDELRTLIMRMGHTLRRFCRERRAARPRPVAANSPLQSYFVDPDFAAVTTREMFSGDV